LELFLKFNVKTYREYYSSPFETDAQATTLTIPAYMNCSPHICGS